MLFRGFRLWYFCLWLCLYVLLLLLLVVFFFKQKTAYEMRISDWCSDVCSSDLSGMCEPVLITTLVVIVIGGIGSVGGAFYSALIVGTVDTLGRAFLPSVLRLVTERSFADAAGPALASMLI